MKATPLDWYDTMLRDALHNMLKEGKSWMLDEDALDFLADALLAYTKALPQRPQETNYRSAGQARAWLDQQGVTIAQWASEHGFNEGLVHEVLTGRRPCRRGQSHNIAVALGMKAGIPTTRPARVAPTQRRVAVNGAAA